MQKLGFFGGCFNPPTIAHLELAKKAIEIAKLDKLYFVPMGDFYKKEKLLPAEERIKMLELAIKNDMKLEVSRIQMEQNKKLYAIDTFKIISEKYNNSDNFFIMGSDNFEKIRAWKDSKELLENYKYIVFNRKDFSGEDVIIVEEDVKIKNISSSLVRSKILKNENIDSLVSEEIRDYIFKNNLYK